MDLLCAFLVLFSCVVCVLFGSCVCDAFSVFACFDFCSVFKHKHISCGLLLIRYVCCLSLIGFSMLCVQFRLIMLYASSVLIEYV